MGRVPVGRETSGNTSTRNPFIRTRGSAYEDLAETLRLGRAQPGDTRSIS
jgi:hypothetical protein